jgi:hypothetical protein
LQWEKCGDGLLQDNILSLYTAYFAVVSNVKDKLRQWILLSYRRTSVLQWPVFLLVYFLTFGLGRVINCMAEELRMSWKTSGRKVS